MAKSSLDKMKERLKKSSPKISGRANLENINQIRNFVFGKSKKMGAEDDVLGIATQKAKKKIANNKKKKTSTTKGKVDVGLQKALKNKKKPFGKSPGALGGKITPTVKKDKTGQAPTKTGKVKATAANTKNYASTLAMQKRLKKLGANINADGIMGPKTRAAIKKYITNPSTLKKNKSKVMVDDFKKSKVKKSASKTGIDGAATTKKKSSKTGLGSKAMSTKTPKTFKGTNITPTKLQRERMRKRMMGST
tara:strand:- start:483 stop:1232 length:750 start_codon:yes stop_codon:yes gene_type:complete